MIVAAQQQLPSKRHGAPAAGEMLAGKYRVEHVLGKGGMGIVVAATHVNLDERFAIKLLLPSMTKNADIVARFLREGRAVIKIRSEHVVRVHDVDTLPSGAPYMVMEYLDGRDLDAVIADDGPMAIDVAVDMLLQACEALSEAHGLGIVHRDLKPANLFLTSRPDGSPSIKILDFGISKMVPRVGRESRVTNTTAIMGSPHYMSPEQLRSTHNVDGRTDIWALGIVLHELLTGASPFEGTTTPEICANVLKEAPAPLRTVREDVPEGLETAVLTCLEKDVALRFDSVAQLALALAPFGTDAARASAERIVRVTEAAGEKVELHRPRRQARDAVSAVRAGRRPRTGIGLAIGAGVLLGLLGGGACAFHRYRSHSRAVDSVATHATSAPAELASPVVPAAGAKADEVPVPVAPTVRSAARPRPAVRAAAPSYAPSIGPGAHEPEAPVVSPEPAGLFEDRK